jgi:glycosyltransferase involved in cell wall biosynthesis
MKVVLVNNSTAVSGGEEYLLDLAQRIGQFGFDPVFFVHEEGVLNQKVRERGYRYHPVFNRQRVAVPFRIAKAIRAEEPEIILVAREHNIYAVLAGSLLARPWLKRKPKLLSVFQTPTARCYPLLTAMYDGVIATSEYTGSSFYPKNPGLEQMTRIIHYGIPIPERQPGKRDIHRERRVLKGRKFPIIGMVGELWKNQEELVDAGVRLCAAFPEITIAIVGGGGTDILTQKIAAYGLENNFILTGRIPREQIPDLFYDLDLSVSTHRNEGFGIVHIESLAACTPVIAYNNGGLVEIIRKGGGILVNGGTDDFSREVITLLSDDDRRYAMGEEGRRVFEENFTLDMMVKNHVEYFQEILGTAVSN